MGVVGALAEPIASPSGVEVCGAGAGVDGCGWGWTGGVDGTGWTGGTGDWAGGVTCPLYGGYTGYADGCCGGEYAEPWDAKDCGGTGWGWYGPGEGAG